YAKIGDADGYRRICNRMLKHFGPELVDGPLVYAAHTYVLAPGALGDPVQVVAVARKRRALPQHPGDVQWARHVLALAHYRGGGLREGVRELPAEPLPSPDSPQGILNGFVLALAYQQQGRVNEARAAYVRTVAQEKRYADRIPAGAGRLAPGGWQWR